MNNLIPTNKHEARSTKFETNPKFEIRNSNLFRISDLGSRIFEKRGFTIIETLVAITVLMIAIAGPLVVASDGLFGALASKDQMIAAYLAQESMETIKNIRDNNEASGATWDTFPGGEMDRDCSSTNYTCDASAVDVPIIAINSTTCNFISVGTYKFCQIYLEPSGAYGHNSSNATATIFKRRFVFAKQGSGVNDAIVTVYVDWNEGTVPYEVALSSELTDSVR